MSTIHTIEVLAAIQSYIETNNRPCPANYLTAKFGDDVAEIVTNLKGENKVISRRGRNGGVMFADTVFKSKNSQSSIEASPVQETEQSTINDEIVDSDDDNSDDGYIGDLPEQIEDELNSSSY